MLDLRQQRCGTDERNLLFACERGDLFVCAGTHAADECEDLVLTIEIAQTGRHIRAGFGEVWFYFSIVDTTTRVQLFEIGSNDLTDSAAQSCEGSVCRQRHTHVDTF
jgi:hypothetical protein